MVGKIGSGWKGLIFVCNSTETGESSRPAWSVLGFLEGDVAVQGLNSRLNITWRLTERIQVLHISILFFVVVVAITQLSNMSSFLFIFFWSRFVYLFPRCCSVYYSSAVTEENQRQGGNNAECRFKPAGLRDRPAYPLNRPAHTQTHTRTHAREHIQLNSLF